MTVLHISGFRMRVLNFTFAEGEKIKFMYVCICMYEGSRTEMEHAVLLVPGHHCLADQPLFTLQNVRAVTLELLRGE